LGDVSSTSQIGAVKKGAKRLKAELPFELYLLDMGGGLTHNIGDENPVDISAVRSTPFLALWNGMSHASIQWKDASHNYILFSFTGGGAGLSGRMLRIHFLTDVLKHSGFEVTQRQDNLQARINWLEQGEIQEKLQTLGSWRLRD